MGLFACFNPRGRQAARGVHAEAGTEVVESTLALPKIDTDGQEVCPHLLGELLMQRNTYTKAPASPRLIGEPSSFL